MKMTLRKCLINSLSFLLEYSFIRNRAIMPLNIKYSDLLDIADYIINIHRQNNKFDNDIMEYNQTNPL